MLSEQTVDLSGRLEVATVLGGDDRPLPQFSLIDHDEKTFTKDLQFTAVQRQLKAVGIFARLNLRDGKPSHLKYIHPVLDRIQRQCAGYRTLAPLAEWLTGQDIDSAVSRLAEPDS